ncbi:hypothetical protein PAHAL_5G301900 [Panicum hallii]|nr:hypothetical protein PAHAL_5G301900 [Panicum hallii]
MKFHTWWWMRRMSLPCSNCRGTRLQICELNSNGCCKYPKSCTNACKFQTENQRVIREWLYLVAKAWVLLPLWRLL